jgi:lipopolysaccharide/colanic/teichoic acid biosynthesis glycosyltransferase
VNVGDQRSTIESGARGTVAPAASGKLVRNVMAFSEALTNLVVGAAVVTAVCFLHTMLPIARQNQHSVKELGAISIVVGLLAVLLRAKKSVYQGELPMKSDDVHPLLLISSPRPVAPFHYLVAKRTADLIVSSLLLVLLAPVLFLIALLVRLDSPGPALFIQKRVGRDGNLFDIYKFRSMYTNAPKYSFSPTSSSDPRITRCGKFLRLVSLDELPQLINVFLGNMSLVGPRPEMPFIVQHYGAEQRQRLRVTPGITGLWQLSAGRSFPIHDNIEYDLCYIQNRSFFLDMAILIQTLFAVSRGV